MDKISYILDKAKKHGVDVVVESDKLKLVNKWARDYDEIKKLVSENKEQIIEYLNNQIDLEIQHLEKFKPSIRGDLINEHWWLFTISPDKSKKIESIEIPIRLYLSQFVPADTESVIEALTTFINEIDLGFITEGQEKINSFWKTWVAKFKSIISSNEFDQLMKKSKRALELAYLDNLQADANNKNSDGAAKLIESLNNIDNCAVQIGSLLIVKTTKAGTVNLCTRTLTHLEMAHIESRPTILQYPEELISMLDDILARVDEISTLEETK